MSLIGRVSRITDNPPSDGEFNNIINTFNNLDGAVVSWANVKTATLIITGSTASTNSAGYVIGTTVQALQFLDTAQSLSSGNNAFTATSTAQAITPKSTTHKIKVSVSSGSLGGSATAGDKVCVTIKRGSTDLASGSNGLAQYINSSIGSTTPCQIVFLDSPSSVSSQTYTVYIKNATSNRAVAWNNDSQTAIILLEEIAF